MSTEEDPLMEIPKNRSSVDVFNSNVLKMRSRSSAWALHPKSHSVMINGAEIRGIRQALEQVERSKDELVAEGLSRSTFFAGIVNVVLITYIFARWPEHLWIFYGVECAIFIPAYWYKVTVDAKGFFFVFDFCWATSILFGMYMFLLLFEFVPEQWRRASFLVLYSCGLGPMSWACIILSTGLVFHSLDKSASLFIHYTPILVSYVVMNFNEEVSDAWPGLFPTLEELAPATVATYDMGPVPMWFFYIDEVFLHGWRFYMVWWVVYGAWLLTVGVYLPEKGFNTVFSNIYERTGMGDFLTRKTGLRDIRWHAAIYMAIHWAGSSFSFFWPPCCFRNGFWMPTHAVWCIVVFLSVVWNGAGHYDFIFAKKYTHVIQAMLEEKG